MGKCRKAFEAHFAGFDLTRQTIGNDLAPFYYKFETQEAWEGWQTSWNAATRDLQEQLAKEREDLRRITLDRDAKSARMWELGKECDVLKEQLAACASARAEMWEAIQPILMHRKDLVADNWFSHEIMTSIEIAAQSTNQNALHAARALECERLAHTEGVEAGHSEWLLEQDAAHRAKKVGE